MFRYSLCYYSSLFHHIRSMSYKLFYRLLDTKDELNSSLRASTSDRMLEEAEIRDLRAKYVLNICS